MSRKSTLSLLENTVELLVQHFGAPLVKAALEKVAKSEILDSKGQIPGGPKRNTHPSLPGALNLLAELRENDVEKHDVLANFHNQLIEGRILPEAQDIRYFAQIIGLKEYGSKSRKEGIQSLMRFLVKKPLEKLRIEVEKASQISEENRQKGFSVLTDKLIGDANRSNG